MPLPELQEKIEALQRQIEANEMHGDDLNQQIACYRQILKLLDVMQDAVSRHFKYKVMVPKEVICQIAEKQNLTN